MDNDKLIFIKQWRDAISPSPPEVRLEVYEAIMSYAFEGIIPEGLSPMAQMAFMFIKPQIDKMEENYMMICERNKRNSANAGAPKGNQNARKKNNPNQSKTIENNPDDCLIQSKTIENNPINKININKDNIVVEEEKEKKKKFPPLPPQRLIKIQDIESYLEGLKDTEQMNSIRLMVSRVAGKVPNDDEMKNYFAMFIDELKIQGVSEKLEKDICQHFVSWARIALPKELKMISNKNKKEEKHEYEFYTAPDGCKPLV